MELHKNIKIDNDYKLSLSNNHLDYFENARRFAFEHYREDIERIAGTRFEHVTPDFFLREMTWCICTSGFNAKVVSKFFPELIKILEPMFTDIAAGKWQYWDDCSFTLDKPLLKIFNNKNKINAITFNTMERVLRGIKKQSWELYRNTELSSPEKLQQLSFIGPTTCYHLARNIGLLDCVKPDLHLIRMALNWNFASPLDLCKDVQNKFNIPLGIIDLIFWYAASTFGTQHENLRHS